MVTATISRKAKSTHHFVTIPRAEYEELLVFKRIFPVVEPTAEESRAIRKGRKEIEAGNYSFWEDVKHELANLRNRKREKATRTRAKV